MPSLLSTSIFWKDKLISSSCGAAAALDACLSLPSGLCWRMPATVALVNLISEVAAYGGVDLDKWLDEAIGMLVAQEAAL